ncbi:MAG: hypothetical protein K2J52_07375 [Duncaniella sp.]|nr:hypothetical protein [Duncaniella sp.]
MNSRKSRIAGAVVTLLFHLLVAVVLATIYLRYSPAEEADRTWPPVDSSEVLFGGEYVMVGDKPELAASKSESAPAEADAPVPEPQVEALENTGTPSPTPAPIVTSEQPSPAKVEKKTAQEPTGPSQAEREAAERARRQEEARQAIAEKVQFGKSGAGSKGEGKAGSPNGNADFGAAHGSPGFNLKGRTLASWDTPPRAPLGTVTIRVTVNRQGIVTDASYASGTGAAAASASTRNHCIRAARASRFSVDTDAPAAQTGTITYRFQ